jgi:hypothetical protein
MYSATHGFWWGFQFVLWIGCLGAILKLLWRSLTHYNVRIAWFGLGASLLFGIIFSPWTSFRQVNTQNPNVITWSPLYRAAAYGWIFTTIIALALVVLLPQLRRRDSWLTRVSEMEGLVEWLRSLLKGRRLPRYVDASIEVMPGGAGGAKGQPIAFVALPKPASEVKTSEASPGASVSPAQ